MAVQYMEYTALVVHFIHPCKVIQVKMATKYVVIHNQKLGVQNYAVLCCATVEPQLPGPLWPWVSQYMSGYLKSSR